MPPGHLSTVLVAAMPFLLLGFLAYAISTQRRAMRNQGHAIAQVETSLARQQEAMENQRRLLELAEEATQLQHESRDLLIRVVSLLERRV